MNDWRWVAAGGGQHPIGGSTVALIVVGSLAVGLLVAWLRWRGRE